MGTRLKVPFQARIKGGGVLTFVVAAVDQAVYWYLEGYDPATGTPCAPVGQLRKAITLTDRSKRATNIYLAPTSDPGGVYDRVTVKVVLD